MNIQTMFVFRDSAGNLLLSGPKKPEHKIVVNIPEGTTLTDILQVYMNTKLFAEWTLQQEHIDAGQIEFHISDSHIEEVRNKK